jgi:hypothetical protein
MLVGALPAEKHETRSNGKKHFDMTKYLEARPEEQNQKIEAEMIFVSR